MGKLNRCQPLEHSQPISCTDPNVTVETDFVVIGGDGGLYYVEQILTRDRDDRTKTTTKQNGQIKECSTVWIVKGYEFKLNAYTGV